nr:PREDICTED: uncharacterized protein LOC109029817 [Bemisia tabaci]
MTEQTISEADVEGALKKMLNWKAPGPDKLQNFWLKSFKSAHQQLARCFGRCFGKILQCPEELPAFLTTGITFLIPKTKRYSDDPAKYRPITCLPTVYKLLASIISEKIYKHLEQNKLLDEEQKGCRKGSRGCKEQLTIDAVITKTAINTKAPLFTAYIDYQKAFDSIPHSWLLEVLEIYGINPKFIQFLAQTMRSWKTELCLNTPGQQLKIGTIDIRRGIFQGDSLSRLWFCLALSPLTKLLGRLRVGCNYGDCNISHLWYMDDLKLFSSQKENLHSMLNIVGEFSSDIQMKFGLDKCKISSIVKGVWSAHEGYEPAGQEGKIEGMLENDQYKYLGYLQARGIQPKEAKQQVSDDYKRRLRSILKSELSARNPALAINTHATSLLTYTFGILNWSKTELNALDIATRREFRKYRAHHPRSCVERFHLPRAEGGRGIPSAMRRHHQQVQNLRKYFLDKAKESKLHQAIARADKNITPLNLNDHTFNPVETLPTTEQTIGQWKAKPLHGRYIERLHEDADIDAKASQSWLHSGGLFVETEGFIAAFHDQVVPTKLIKSG